MTTIYKEPPKAGGKAKAFPPAPYALPFKFFAVFFTPPYDGQKNRNKEMPYDGQEKKSSASLPFWPLPFWF